MKLFYTNSVEKSPLVAIPDFDMLLPSESDLLIEVYSLAWLCLEMKRSKGEGSCTTLDEALKVGKLSREDFFRICGELEQGFSSSNKRFFELFDLIMKQRFQKEEEYKKRVGFRI